MPFSEPTGPGGQAGTWVTDLINRLTGLFWVKGPFPSLHQFLPGCSAAAPPWPTGPVSPISGGLCASQQEPLEMSWSEGNTDLNVSPPPIPMLRPNSHCDSI